VLYRSLVVGLGGFFGANARYLIGGWVQQKWGASFPYGTFFINVSGSFILAFFATLALRFGWAESWRLFFAVGFVGAYTTFSTFEYESIQLVATGGRWGITAINLIGSVVVGFAAAYLGIVAARLLMRAQT